MPIRRSRLAALAMLVAIAMPSRASAQVPCYIVGLVGTTIVYRPPGGPVLGPQGDLSMTAGGGCFAFEKVAFELDASVTRIAGDPLLVSLVPGVVWAWSEHFYAAGRALVSIAPERAVTLFPGLGAIYTFTNGLAPLVEMNVAVGLHGEPDVGLALTTGLSYSL